MGETLQLNNRSPSNKKFKQKKEPQFGHYEDFTYQQALKVEVDQMRKLLDADFKNQRIIDLENKIRDNKRIIVNVMTENIFMLRFGFDGNQ